MFCSVPSIGDRPPPHPRLQNRWASLTPLIWRALGRQAEEAPPTLQDPINTCQHGRLIEHMFESPNTNNEIYTFGPQRSLDSRHHRARMPSGLALRRV